MFKRFLRSLRPPVPGAWHPTQPSAAEQRALAQWVAAGTYRNWTGPYFKAYHYGKAGINAPQGLRVQLLHDCGRQGAVFFYDPSIGPQNFRFFFDFLRDQVLGQGYNLASSDWRTRKNEHCTETVHKHFLKPKPQDCPKSGNCNQRFGTITLDLILMNGNPGFIRFSQNPYQDAIFTPPHSFDELMELVLQHNA